MAAGDNFIPIGTTDQWILDVNNNLVGVRNQRANGADLRPTQASDLAASTGSSLVGFQQAGTGAGARTLQDKVREIVSLKDFATGDGTTVDTDQVRKTIASHVDLYVNEGTFVIGPTASSGDFMLYLGTQGPGANPSSRNGMRIYGAGSKSIIKLADNVGANRLLFGAGTGDSLANMLFKDFAIDLNGANNLQANFGDPMRYNSAFYFSCQCQNIEFNNLDIYNGSGSQWIRVGDDTAAHYGKDIRVINCRFDNFGIGLAGNKQQDVSVLYIQADQIRVEGCAFRCADFTFDLSRGHTACELHGDTSTKVIGNTFAYVQLPVLIASSEKATSGVLIDENTFVQCNYLASLDASYYDQKRITISGNDFFSTKAASSALVVTGTLGEVSKTREDVVFSGNTVSMWGNANQQTHLFYLGNRYIRSLLIEDNNIVGMNGSVVYMDGTVENSGYFDLSIKGNRLDSLGATSGAYPNSPAFVHIETSAGTVSAVVITGNTLFNSAGKDYTAFGCFKLSGGISFTYVARNESMVTSYYPHVTDGITGASFKCIEPPLSTGHIQFPATAVPSSDPYTLDDYREGVAYTATFVNGTVTSTSDAKYHKVGSLVTAHGEIDWTAVAGAGTVAVSLPFTAKAGKWAGSLGYVNGLDNGGGKQLVLVLDGGSSALQVFMLNDNAAATASDVANMSATGAMQFTITYEATT